MADRRRMVALVREQAEGCAALGSPLYEFLLQRVADDIEAGGRRTTCCAVMRTTPARAPSRCG